MRGDDGSTGKISSARCNEELVCAAYNVASALSQALAIEYDKIGQDERIAKFATHAFAAIEELVCLLARWRRGNLAHVDGNISVQSNGTDRTEKTPIPLPLHLSTEGLELMTDIAFAQLGEQWLTNYDSSSQPSAGSRSVSMAYTIWNAYGSAYDKLRTWADGAGLGDMDQEHLTPVPGHLARLTAVKRHYYFARSAMDAMNLVADEKNGSDDPRETTTAVLARPHSDAIRHSLEECRKSLNKTRIVINVPTRTRHDPLELVRKDIEAELDSFSTTLASYADVPQRKEDKEAWKPADLVPANSILAQGDRSIEVRIAEAGGTMAYLSQRTRDVSRRFLVFLGGSPWPSSVAAPHPTLSEENMDRLRFIDHIINTVQERTGGSSNEHLPAEISQVLESSEIGHQRLWRIGSLFRVLQDLAASKGKFFPPGARSDGGGFGDGVMSRCLRLHQLLNSQMADYFEACLSGLFETTHLRAVTAPDVHTLSRCFITQSYSELDMDLLKRLKHDTELAPHVDSFKKMEERLRHEIRLLKDTYTNLQH